MKIFKLSNANNQSFDFSKMDADFREKQKKINPSFNPKDYHSEWDMIYAAVQKFKKREMTDFELKNILQRNLSQSSVWRPYLDNINNFVKQIDIHAIKISGL